MWLHESGCVMSVFLVTQEYYKQVALNIIINIFANVLFGINGDKWRSVSSALPCHQKHGKH